MAWLVADSFDYYGLTGDLARSVWDSVGNSGNFNAPGVGPRFGVGQDYAVTVFDNLTKVFATNEPTIYIVFAIYRPGAQSGTATELYFTLYDGTTAQCFVYCSSGGALVLGRGANAQAPTIIAQTATGFIPQDLWTHIQVKVVIDPTVGEFRIRKNGVPADSFAATALNTRSSANSYANKLTLGGQNGYATLPYIDDLLIYSGSGVAPNTWVGDVRALCQYASADTAQKNFAPSSTTALQVANDSNSGASVGNAANRIYWTQSWTPTHSGQVGTVVCSLGAAITGHFQAAIYDNLGPGGQPGNLVGVCTPVTNPPSGQFNNTPAAPLLVAANRTYYVAYFADVVIQANGWGGPNTYYTDTVAYTSGYPASAPAVLPVLTGYRIFFTIILTINNAMNCGESLANGDTDYVSSSNVNDEDLYTVAPMGITPFAILGVVSKVYIRKSDAGTRQGQLRVKSGTTEVFGVDTAVSSTWSYLSRVDAVDPNTSAAWTKAGINALQVGQKVTL